MDVKQHSDPYYSDCILLSNNDEQKCVRPTSQLENSIVMRPFQADSLRGIGRRTFDPTAFIYHSLKNSQFFTETDEFLLSV